jgi:antitoxin (DNA-binding transcriptional repressor) of toxin-antitoxin stability system
MHQRITVTEAARHFAEFLNRVAFGGEQFILLRGKKPVAELRPVIAGRGLEELPSLIQSLPPLAEGDVAEFEKDISSARTALGKTRINDPWES